MPSRPFVDGAVIQERYDGVNVGDPIMPCRITTFQESPNARARAAVWVDEDKDFVEFDHLEEVEIRDEGGKTYSYTGISTRLQNVNKLSRDDARVEWIITVKACEGCM